MPSIHSTCTPINNFFLLKDKQAAENVVWIDKVFVDNYPNCK